MHTSIDPSIATPSRPARSPRAAGWLVAAGLALTGCGSSPFGGMSDEAAGRPASTEPRVDIAEACRSLREVRTLSDRYGDHVDGVMDDAERVLRNHADADADEVVRESLRDLIDEIDPFTEELLASYAAAAEAAPADVARDIRLVADFTEDIIDSWRSVVDHPDLDAELFLAAIYERDETEMVQVLVATERVNAFASDECGFELTTGA